MSCRTWGEHSCDGWYVGMSLEHYRTHIVFVKATKQHLRLSDTVYFKHKYITQPTITTADRIVNAYHELTRAIEGFPNSKGGANMEALQCLHEALSPGNSRIVPHTPAPQFQSESEQATPHQHRPMVQFSEIPLQLTLYDSDPRVPMFLRNHHNG
jgi:hypothetical protein